MAWRCIGLPRGRIRLAEYASDVDLTEARRLFLMADLALRAAQGELTKGELLGALRGLGVPVDEVKAALDVLYGEGLTSRYNDAGGPESPAFIVLDREGLRAEVERAVRLVESAVLG